MGRWEGEKINEDSDIYSQIMEYDDNRIAMNEQINSPVEEDKSKNIKTHPQAIYTSRLFKF